MMYVNRLRTLFINRLTAEMETLLEILGVEPSVYTDRARELGESLEKRPDEHTLGRLVASFKTVNEILVPVLYNNEEPDDPSSNRTNLES